MSQQVDKVHQQSAAEAHLRIVELEQKGQSDDAILMIDPDVVDHRGGLRGDVHGLSAWKEKWEHMNDGLQDVTWTVEQNVSVGDISVNRYTLRGTHTASGRRYEINSLDMVRMRDGKIVEHWGLRDKTAMRHQLGLDMPPRDISPPWLGT
jgi:predicted ester cyclase